MAIGKTERVAAEIRPGVFRPDWSAIRSRAARSALGGRMAARASLLEQWCHALEPDEDLVWRTVLRRYAETGRAPRPEEIAAETAIGHPRVSALLRKLEAFDLVGLEPGTDLLRYAYPFTEAAMGQRVKLNGHSLNALCAIDALGVGAMYRTDASVDSRCRLCVETISIATAHAGRALRDFAPAGAVVWYDYAYQGCASESCCPSIAFFCTDEHLRRWLDTQTPRRQGVRLAMNEALELGRAIFGPVLQEPHMAGTANASQVVP